MLEHRLCGDEFTIADPFIETIGMDSTSKNRVLVSYFIAIGFFIFFFIVYYFRFYYNIKIKLPNLTQITTIVNEFGEEVTKM